MSEEHVSNLDMQIAERLFGWKWMSWTGRPVHGPHYPGPCRVKQFMSPEQLAHKSWQEFFADPEIAAAPATGDEPYSYTHLSSGCNAAMVPAYSGSSDVSVLEFVRKKWKRDQPEMWNRFLELCPGAATYKRGDYSRAAIKVIDSTIG